MKLSEYINKKLGYNLKESRYIIDIVKSYHLKESNSYYSILPDLLKILDSDLPEIDKIKDLAIMLSLYYKNDSDFQNIDDSEIQSVITNDINSNMDEIKERLANNQLSDLIDRVISIYLKL